MMHPNTLSRSPWGWRPRPAEPDHPHHLGMQTRTGCSPGAPGMDPLLSLPCLLPGLLPAMVGGLAPACLPAPSMVCACTSAWGDLPAIAPDPCLLPFLPCLGGLLPKGVPRGWGASRGGGEGLLRASTRGSVVDAGDTHSHPRLCCVSGGAQVPPTRGMGQGATARAGPGPALSPCSSVPAGWVPFLGFHMLSLPILPLGQEHRMGPQLLQGCQPHSPAALAPMEAP